MASRDYFRPAQWATVIIAAIWLLLGLADAHGAQHWWSQLWRSHELMLLPGLVLFWGLTLACRPR